MIPKLAWWCPICTFAPSHTPLEPLWIFGRRGEWSKWVTVKEPRSQKQNWSFLTHSSLFSPAPLPEINLLTLWNKPFRVYSLVCHGWRVKVDNGEQMGEAEHYYASDWNRLAGFRELVIWFWGAMTFLPWCSLFLPLDFEMDCTCRCLSVYWVSPICLLKANHENRSCERGGGGEKTSNFHLLPPSVPHWRLKVNRSVPSKHTSNAAASHVRHSYGVGAHTA